MRLGLLIFAVLLSQPVMAGNIIDNIPLSEQCKEQVTEHNLSGYEITDDTEINVSTRTDAKHSIERVRFTPFIYGMLFKANGQQILHCVDPFINDDFILVEESVDYSLFQLDEFKTIKFYIHSKVNCGSNCYYSRVDAIAIPDNTDFEPIGYIEMKSGLYDYPSKWFKAYLNNDEQQMLHDANR